MLSLRSILRAADMNLGSARLDTRQILHRLKAVQDDAGRDRRKKESGKEKGLPLLVQQFRQPWETSKPRERPLTQAVLPASVAVRFLRRT
jgi:hypothetical protein